MSLRSFIRETIHLLLMPVFIVRAPKVIRSPDGIVPEPQACVNLLAVDRFGVGDD
jgi:hypothetical protein